MAERYRITGNRQARTKHRLYFLWKWRRVAK